MKEFVVNVKGLEIKVFQKDDGKFIIPNFVKELEKQGTCLKPAFEPIIVARKPFSGSLVDNILEYGVGGLNIDECRVPFEDTQNPATNPLYRLQNGYKTTTNANAGDSIVNFGTSKNETNVNGRFPANIITDGSDEVVSGFPNSKGASSQNNFSNGHIFRGQSLNESCTSLNGYREWYNDDGSASRYFYCAKASKKDRDEGLDEFQPYQVKDGRTAIIDNAFQRGEALRRNIHPTVKPTSLMQYLVRLVSPKGATILDPFMGSGSTDKACMIENTERNAEYKFIGVEMTDEYLPIANARIKYWIGKQIDSELFVEASEEDLQPIVEKSKGQAIKLW